MSVILHNTKESRKYQTFVFDDWLGGFYASPNMQGTRSGLPMACAWAVMQHLGVDGYVDLTQQTLINADLMRAGIMAVDGVRVLGEGQFHLLQWLLNPTAASTCSHSAMRSSKRGWYHDRQTPPDNLHSTVSNTNTGRSISTWSIWLSVSPPSARPMTAAPPTPPSSKTTWCQAPSRPRQLICRVVPSQKGSRSLNFWSLPVAVRASSSRNSIFFGHL